MACVSWFGSGVACGCDSFSRRGSSMAILEEGRMALHCEHVELRQRHEGSLKSCCFSGSQRQNMRRFKLHRLVNEGVWVSVVSCFKVEHSQCRITVSPDSFALSPLGGDLNSRCCQDLNPTFGIFGSSLVLWSY
ncbi:BnaC08g02540D [Brassica napus]|uniref:(rape) hypothetical protein n=1 Tax=Brassica napus TaxID=3708 RepID=A0A078H5V2_BRANA|nr:unnamed protein product [Brassica napus]CDY32832.1 BnaC08g02540D [Brassica napus]